MIQYTELPNGIRIVSENAPHFNSVALGAFFAVGSRYETKEQNGISHMLEHMVFKRTKNRTAFDISRQIEDVGGLINAYTAQNVTAFHANVMKEDMPLALDLIADITQNAVCDKNDFQQELNVVLQELRMSKDDPDELVGQHFLSAAYPNQPYGRPIAGSFKTLKSFSREDLLHYMRTKYTANRLVLSVAGNIEHESFVDKCAKLFKHLPAFPYTNPLPAVYKGGEYRKQTVLEEAYISLGFKGPSKFDPDIYAEHILSTLLCSGVSSRLFFELREKRGLVYSITPVVCNNSENGFLSFDMSTEKRNLKELMPVLLDELNKVPNTLTDEEIKRAKTIEKTAVIRYADDVEKMMEINALNIINHGRVIERQEEIKGYESVTKEQVKRVAQTIFSQKPTLSAIGPIGTLMPYHEIRARLGQQTSAQNNNATLLKLTALKQAKQQTR